jgi:hypothetical protein
VSVNSKTVFKRSKNLSDSKGIDLSVCVCVREGERVRERGREREREDNLSFDLCVL